MPTWLFLLLATASLCSLFYYYQFIRELREDSDTSNAPIVSLYKWPDFVVGGLLVAFFLQLILMPSDAPQVVNFDILIKGAQFYLCLVVAIFGFLIFRGMNPLHLFGLAPIELRRRIFLGLKWLLIAYPVLMVTQIISYHLFSDQPDPQPVVMFLIENDGWKDRLAVILLALVAAPLAEEVIFRGYLYGMICSFGGRWSAICTSSLLFAAIHLHWPSMAGLFLLGVVLALLYEKTKSLWVPLIMHSVFNGISVCMAIFWPELLK